MKHKVYELDSNGVPQLAVHSGEQANCERCQAAIHNERPSTLGQPNQKRDAK